MNSNHDQTDQINGKSCDPEEFYKDLDTSSLNFVVSLKPYISSVTFVLVFVMAPFLILCPFIMAKLRTLCRQVMAMIILSDVVNTSASLFSILGDSSWSNDPDSLNLLCAVVEFIKSASSVWSASW